MDQNIKLVLKYLKEHDFIEAFLTLQRQSEVKLLSYSREIEFFKKILLRGDFPEALTFIATFENRVDEKDYRKILLDLHRQKLYELIENPNEEELRALFEKDLLHCCSEEEFQELFTCLTFRSVAEIEGMERWSVIKGRYECFESIIPYLELFNSVVRNEEIEERLQDIVQFYYSGREGSPKGREGFGKKSGAGWEEERRKEKQEKQEKIDKMEKQEKIDKMEKQEKVESVEREKETIKNSIINMNLSGNYSQMKSKLQPNMQASGLNAPNSSKKYNYSSFEENESRMDKSQLPKNEPTRNEPTRNEPNRNEIYLERNNSNLSNPSSIDKTAQEKRPRVNASLNGPMTREKIDSTTTRVDNYLKSDLQSDNPRTAKPIDRQQRDRPLQKSHLPNPSLLPSQLSNPSQLSKSKQYPKPREPVLLSHYEIDSSQLNQISQQQQSEVRSVKAQKQKQKQKYGYLGRSKRQQEELQAEVKKNIEYLEQTSSVIYKNKEELEQENFTFSNHPEADRPRKVSKLAVITDGKAIRTCQFADSGNYFAVGTNSSVLKIFDVQRLFARNASQELPPLYQIDNLHAKSIFCLQWASNERSLATCSNDLTLKVTDLNRSLTEHKTTTVGKHDSCIRMVKFNPQESRLFSCGDDCLIKAWDLGKVKKCVQLKSHSGGVTAFKLQNDNELYSVSKDYTIKKWDLRLNEHVATSKVQESELTYIANNTDRIVVSHRDGNVSFFNSSLQLEHAAQIHEQEIRSVEALRGEGTLLTASFDGHVALFTENGCLSPNYFQHNDNGDDKVVFATFLHSPHFKGFASTSTQGLCHLYSYQ